MLEHSSGTVRSLAMSLRGSAYRLSVDGWGDGTSFSLPDEDTSPESSFALAADALVDAASKDQPQHPCDADFGAEVVAVLASVEQEISNV